MASLSFYDVSVGSYTRALKVLHRILTKASASNADPSLLDNARLAPDMYKLSRQIEIATMFAGELAEGVTGRKFVPWAVRADGELGWGAPWDHVSWAEAIARVETALGFLEKEVAGIETALDAGVAEEKVLPLRIAGEVFDTPAPEYVLANGLPNILFHVYTAYGILRAQGIEIGKVDILFPFSPQSVKDAVVSKGVVAAA